MSLHKFYLREWKLSTNNSQTANTEDFTENFKKLVNHLKTIFGCSVVELESQELLVRLAFGYHRQMLHIRYLLDKNVLLYI